MIVLVQKGEAIETDCLLGDAARAKEISNRFGDQKHDLRAYINIDVRSKLHIAS